MSDLTDRYLNYRVPHKTLELTLQFLQIKAFMGDEGVVLWPGRLHNSICEIGKPLIPGQITEPFRYQIPRDAVLTILEWTRRNNCVIPIQVHSHLLDAFHSQADDELALVQHKNGISIVVPDGGNIAVHDFWIKAKFFRLVEGTTWQKISREEVRRRFKWLPS